MRQAEFIAPYERDVSFSPAHAELSGLELEWGTFFGQVLYDRLNGSDPLRPDGLDDGKLLSYCAQGSQNYADWFDQLSGGEHGNRHGFHLLNINMLEQWRGLPPEQPERRRTIQLQQDQIALLGLGMYVERERLFADTQRTATPHPERQHIEGFLNECDAAVVLLEIQRRQPAIVNVLPAPYQFECGQRQARNADFIVLTEYEALGVQVKSSVRDHTVSSYDRERIMLLDANLDLGNVLAKKVVGKSTPQVQGWGGIICAQRLHTMKTEGGGRLTGTTVDQRKAIMRMRFRARQLVHGIRPNFQRAVEQVEDRLLARLRAA